MCKRFLLLCFVQYHRDVVDSGVRMVALCPTFVDTMMVPDGVMNDLIDKIGIMS